MNLKEFATKQKELERMLSTALAGKRPGNAGKIQDSMNKSHDNSNDGLPFKHSGEFLMAVKDFAQGRTSAMQNYDNWLKKSLPTGYNESAISDGGALVPQQFANEILMRVYENELLNRVRMMPMTSNMLRIPAINETSRINGSRFGGVTGYWRGEGGDLTLSKGAFQNVELKLESLTVACKATDELLQDAVALNNWVTMVANEEIAFKFGDAVVNGDGAGKPQGFMNSAAKVTVNKVTGQTAATVVAQNIYDMWGRMWGGCRKNGIWLVSASVWAQLFAMTTGNFPIFLPNNSAIGEPGPTLLGRPVFETEWNATLGTEGDILFVDPTQYLWGNAGGIQAATSMHVYFLTNEQAFKFVARVDGKCWWTSALTPFKGSATQSPIISLQTRS